LLEPEWEEMSALIQIIEDNATFATAIKNVLEIEGYRVRIHEDGAKGLAFARTSAPDLIILDLTLPDMDGHHVLKALRDAGQTMPILILSARCEEAERILGLRSGADDFVTKPFSLMELLARIGALLRRARGEVKPQEQFAESTTDAPDLEINLRHRTVSRYGREITLAPKEFDLLVALADRRGAVVSRSELLREVWGHRHVIITRTVDAHILSLRKKIEDDPTNPKLIVTVQRAGYRLALDPPRLTVVGVEDWPSAARARLRGRATGEIGA
jgi:two-component system alkaline phosphatase synthesis response regulator PhoP